MVRRTENYLNNKDLLIQIHESKLSYCEFEKDDYKNYDQIIYDLNVLTDDKVCSNANDEYNITYGVDLRTGRDDKQNILSKKLINTITVEKFIKKVKKNKIQKMKKQDSTIELTEEEILTSDLIFRLMTYNHIPLDEKWDPEREKKKVSDGHIKVSFPPFKHYIIENGVPRCVGQSHYLNNEFSSNHGKINERLGKMFMLLVEKISKKGNWRNYTYIDEMKSSSLLQLSKVGLQFDEGRSEHPNPFAFYTTVVNNAFKRVLITEKKNRDIRDDLIQIAGQTPSLTRQMEEMKGPTKEYYDGLTSLGRTQNKS